MATTKLRWEFPQREEIMTTHLSPSQKGKEDAQECIQVRNCLNGYNEQGVLKKVLYCSSDGRFFVRYPDGWHKIEPCTQRGRRGYANRNPKSGGCFDTAFMRNFGSVPCHRLVAYAWCDWPAASIHDREWYKKYEVDHLNSNHADYDASNLEWVRPEENRRRSKEVLRPLRKTGIDPKLLDYGHLNNLYSFEDCQLEYFFEELPKTIAAMGDAELNYHNINQAVKYTIADTLDNTIHCSRCGCAMIKDSEEHYTHSGILCDCCYGDLFG